jgi:putative transcriptional regulator
MTPAHHPSPERLLEFAAGSLQPGRRLVVHAHVFACGACARQTRLAEAVGGALLETLPPAEMRSDALARALARIETAAPGAPPAPPRGPGDWIEVPAEVAAAARRRRWTAPGVWVAPMAGGPRGERSYLLRVGARMSVPRHTHEGVEMVCILKGAFVDRGVTYAAGDFIESDEEIEHSPMTTSQGECVCLVAADGALVPLDWVGRLFQPLVRI